MSKKVIIEKNNGEEVAKATVVFDLGKVHREEPDSTSVVLGVDIDGMERYYKQAIYERAVNECEFKDYEELLEQYVGSRINQMIGVKSSPLTIDAEGKLVGLDESIEVEFKNDIKDDIEDAKRQAKHASINTTSKSLEGKE